MNLPKELKRLTAVKMSDEKIAELAKAHFSYVDGSDLSFAPAWDELSDDTRQFFIARMKWAVERVK